MAGRFGEIREESEVRSLKYEVWTYEATGFRLLLVCSVRVQPDRDGPPKRRTLRTRWRLTRSLQSRDAFRGANEPDELRAVAVPIVAFEPLRERERVGKRR